MRAERVGRCLRRVARRSGLLLLVAIASVPLAASPSWACSCARSTEEAAFAASSSVFVGVVRDVDDPGEGQTTYTTADSLVWTFEVEQVQKGSAADVERVQTARSGTSCGIEFRVGERYQVFTAAGDPPTTDLCSGTRHLAAGDEPYEPAPPTALIVGAVAGALLLAWSFRRVRDVRIGAEPPGPID